MPRTNVWNRSVPRVELDQRSREARLRLEQIERLLMSLAAVRQRQTRLRRLLYLFRGRIYRGALQESRVRESRVRGPLSDRRPSRIPIWPLGEALP
jgi:hypothetical protein